MPNLKTLNDVEIRWISNELENFSVSDQTIVGDRKDEILVFLFDSVSKSDFDSILQKSLNFYGFSSTELDVYNIESSVLNLLNQPEDENPCNRVNEFILYFIGISALQEFVRCNFCGPTQSLPQSYRLVSELLPDSVTNARVSQLLNMDGEAIYAHTVHPKLLYLSHCLLLSLEKCDFSCLKWWLIRITFVYQRILPERNETLHSKLVSLIDEVYQVEWLLQDEHVSQKIVFATEASQIFLYYGEIKFAKKYISEAQAIAGLQINLSGAIGKRTHYQQKPVAQLYVKLSRSHSRFKGFLPEKNKLTPEDLQLQDDTLLNKVVFMDKDEQALETLYAEEQAVLLGYCCLVQKSGSCDQLRHEEVMSCIDCVLSQPPVWPVYVNALILRCRAEKSSSRRAERAGMQMETILKCINESCVPPLSERQKLFYSSSLPAYWVLEKEQADLLMAIGCIKSALEVYEKLELWEDIVECNIRLGRSSVAEKQIREQLAKAETPLLWCLLGYVTENSDHYSKAWELSGHKSARAQRSLGYHYYKKNEYSKSIPPFLASLKLNNLQPQVWFSVGHAATQIEDFELAAKAYRQVVTFDDDYFEAWNNLAGAYLKTKQKVRAWRSFNEALKCNYEEWRVWENFLLVSTDIGAYEDALKAWHRLFDLKGKHNDSLLLEILVNAIINDSPDINGIPSARLKKRTLELLGRITAVVTKDPKVWELYSALSHSTSEDTSQQENLEKVIHYLQKGLTCHNQSGLWERDYNACKDALLCAEKLAQYSVEYVSRLEGTFQNQQKMSAKRSLQPVIVRGSKNLSDFPVPEKDELCSLIDSLKNAVNKILSL